MSAGVTFERVYLALKDQLGQSRFAAGQHLEPAALSQDLNASVTPVRDALHRLTGEGLVETPRGEGFRTPSVTEIGLRHLYRWNGGLLDLALRSRTSRAFAAALQAENRLAESRPGDNGPGDGEAAENGSSLLERTEALFLAVAARAGNPEHVAAIAHLNDRLRPARRAELGLLEDLETELDELAHRLAEGTPLPLRRTLAAFHRRRERIVGELVAALHTPH